MNTILLLTTLAIGAAAVVLAVLALVGPRIQRKIEQEHEAKLPEPGPIRHGADRSRLG